MNNKKNIVFTGGGTAGHIIPNLALIEKIKDQYNVHYIGSENGIEKELIGGIDGITFHSIPCTKLVRKLSIKNLKIPYGLIVSIKKAKAILKEIQPTLVFSKGGYVALPVCLAAKKICPIVCHESDLKIGLTTRLTAKKAKYLCTGFDKKINGFDNQVCTGLPLRQSLYRDKEISKKPVLLIMGGSLGSSAINDCLIDCIDSLTKTFDIIHLTGKGKKNTQINNPHYQQIEFCKDMGQLYRKASIAVSRGGATSLFELIALKIPSVIIPLPKAISRGDQIDNAKYFADLGLCHVLPQEQLDPKSLIKSINDCYNSKTLKANLVTAKKIDGTQKILSMIKSIIDNQ